MNFDQLAGLIKAGFNEEQIKNIGSIMDTGTGTGTKTDTPTPTPTPTDEPKPTDTPKPADTPKPTDTPKPVEQGPASGATNPPAENETVMLLKEMLGLIRKGNIDGMGGGTLNQPTGSDVLAEILNPTPKK